MSGTDTSKRDRVSQGVDDGQVLCVLIGPPVGKGA